jgi:hypothetical protein
MTSRDRDAGRSYVSGYEKRKQKAIAEERKSKDVATNRKISELFAKPVGTSATVSEVLPKPPLPLLSSSPPLTTITKDYTATSLASTSSSTSTSSSFSNIYLLSDPSTWCHITDELRQEYARSSVAQNLDIDFRPSARSYNDGRIRYLTPSLFVRRLSNGETINRSWLLYSESSKKVYCGPCKLFSYNTNSFTSGFNDWKHGKVVCEHENSEQHRNSIVSSISLGRAKGRMDSALATEFEKERQYWRNVLTRVVAVVRFLSQRGMAFRGESEQFGSCNNGNFMGIMELLAQFDPFLASHISKFGNPGKGKVSYLSPTTFNEFIHLMAIKVISQIVREVKAAKYNAISVDSTPDISHVDQLTFMLRYITKDGTPVERFLKFIPISDHHGEALAHTILSTLEEHGLSLDDCRGQCYDNASNMSGKYQGVQTRLKQINPLAEYVPCSAHSLNLVGSCAVECCVDAVSYFGFLQALFNFFSASTYRWGLLVENIQGLVPKSLSATRWSARADANLALRRNFAAIRTVLETISASADRTAMTRNEASSLAKKMNELEVAVMCVFWNSILQRFNATSKNLQSVKIDLETCVALYNSLLDFIQSARTMESFISHEEEAKLLVANSNYKEVRSRKRKRGAEEPDTENVLDYRERFRTSTYLAILDCLSVQLTARREAYGRIQQKFGFLFQMSAISNGQLRESARRLQGQFPKDLDCTFEDEVVQLAAYLGQLSHDISSPLSILKHIRDNNITDTFPNVDIALRLYSTLPVSNAEGERSFSLLKRVKNHLRSTISQERLSDLSLLAIESGLTSVIDFDDIIDTFAQQKSRKRTM